MRVVKVRARPASLLPSRSRVVRSDVRGEFSFSHHEGSRAPSTSFPSLTARAIFPPLLLLSQPDHEWRSASGAHASDVASATTRSLRELDRHPREVSVNDASARRGLASSSSRVAFGKTVPSDDPRIVTFAGKHSFDAFSRSLVSDALDRSSRAYDSRRPGPGPPRPAPRPPPPARPPPVVQSTRDLARARNPTRDDRTPLEAYESAREAAREAAVRPAMDRIPVRIPLAQDAITAAVRDRGPNYPRGPFAEFKWVFSRDPGPDDAALPVFYRHHRRLKPGPAHADLFLGEPTDARLLVIAERDAKAAEAAKAATSSGVRWGRDEKKKPASSKLRLAHRPGHLAPAYPAGQTKSSKCSPRTSSFRGAGGGATLAGATTSGGGFWVPGDAANGVATRRVKTCSAYATRLIERGRVGGMVTPKDARGVPIGNALVGVTATRAPDASLGADESGITWRSAAEPLPTSLERGDVAGLPRHSAARAKLRREDSFRRLSVRASATVL